MHFNIFVTIFSRMPGDAVILPADTYEVLDNSHNYFSDQPVDLRYTERVFRKTGPVNSISGQKSATFILPPLKGANIYDFSESMMVCSIKLVDEEGFPPISGSEVSVINQIGHLVPQ